MTLKPWLGSPSFPAAGAGQQVTQSVPTENRSSNARFRSFAERYVVERCRNWPEDQQDEMAWKTIQKAKTVYRMVRDVGTTVNE